MAVATPTSILSEEVGTDGTSFTTVGTLAPTSGRLYQFVTHTMKSSANIQDGTLVHNGGLALTKVTATNTTFTMGAQANAQRMILWYGVAAGTEVSGTFTFTQTSEAESGLIILGFEIASGFNTTTPVPQTAATTAAGGLAVTPTLAGAFQDANSITLSAAIHGDSTTAWTLPTGWTGLHNKSGTGNSPAQDRTAYILSNDATADWTTVATVAIGGIIWEVAATPAATGGSVGVHNPATGVHPSLVEPPYVRSPRVFI